MIDKVELPNDFKPQGKIKIELFDDLTGRKIDEIKSHNFIAPHVRNNIFRYAMFNLFSRNRKNIGKDIEISDVFRCLYLTNATHQEDPNNELALRGDIIGWGRTTEVYAGNDTKLGTFNTAESFIKFGLARFVFDFPTHSANGTFQSVYFGAEYINYKGFYIKDIGHTIIGNFRIYNGYFVVQKATYENSYAVFRRYNRDWEMQDEWKIPVYSRESGKIFIMGKSFTIVGNMIYYLCVSYDEEIAIWRAPMSDPTNISKYKVFPLKAYTTSYNPGGLEYDPRRSNWHFYAYTKDYKPTQYVCDENLNVLDSRFDKELMLNYIGNNVFLDGENMFYFESNQVHPSDAILNKMLNTRDYSIVGVDEEFFYTQRNVSSSEIYACPKGYIGSRCLLDSPVTKTSTNTMKITYDFILG